jgi:hypothetical protein
MRDCLGSVCLSRLTTSRVDEQPDVTISRDNCQDKVIIESILGLSYVRKI